MLFPSPKPLKATTRYTAPTNKINTISGGGRSRLVGEHTDITRKIPSVDIRWQEPPNPYIKRDQDGNYTWHLGKPLRAEQVCFWFDRQRQPHMYISREEGTYINGDPRYVWKRVLMGFNTLDARTGTEFNSSSQLYPQ
jgi:hypothetical protein